MDTKDIQKKFQELHQKHTQCLEKLVAPAKAALNAMKDAKMNATADPLGQALFEVDASNQAIHDFIASDPKAVLTGLLEALREDR